MKHPIFIFILLLLFSSVSHARVNKTDTLPASVNKDAKTIVSDYITTIGGVDAIKKLNSVNANGTLSVQGTSLDVNQKKLSPNKTLQTVTMGGNVVGKTVFDGTKGYAEQMGNRTDMSGDDLADLKLQTSLIEQTDYLTNSAYKMAVSGMDTINGSQVYKIAITMPSGKADTEYYDATSKLLVKKIVQRMLNGQDITTVYGYDNYKKAGTVLLPYTLTVGVAAGIINQSFTILFTDIKVNEGVSDADFQ